MDSVFEKWRRLVDARIPQVLDDCYQEWPESVRAPSMPLMDAVQKQAKASSAGGKRLRALLVIASALAAMSRWSGSDTAEGGADGSNSEAAALFSRALDVACAVEVFQTGALVHDDIIDGSDLRRGAPAAHTALASAFAGFRGRALGRGDAGGSNAVSSASVGDIAEIPLTVFASFDQAMGDNLGIILGDYLASASLTAASTAVSGRPEAPAVVDTFLAMQRDVEVGQVLDLADSSLRLDNPAAIVTNCRLVFDRKTASYTTVAPLRLGFLLAGMDATQAWKWGARIGAPAGIAFQIADDLADILPQNPPTGKPLGGDILNGKRSVLLADALEQGNEATRRLLRETYAKPERDRDDIRLVTDAFVSSGAVDASRARIRRLWNETREQIGAWQRETGVSGESARALEAMMALFVPEQDR